MLAIVKLALSRALTPGIGKPGINVVLMTAYKVLLPYWCYLTVNDCGLPSVAA
jgi:hypothetical protein